MIIKENINEKINSPEKAASIFYAILDSENPVDQEKEHFWVIGLNNIMQLKYLELVSLGTLNSSLVEPREVFRMAIMKGVAGIVLAHNHPSGDMNASNADKRITEKLIKGGEILNIPVYDHLIIGKNRYFSFKENDLM